MAGADRSGQSGLALDGSHVECASADGAGSAFLCLCVCVYVGVYNVHGHQTFSKSNDKS